MQRNWTSPVGALGGLLDAAGRSIDQVDLMGLTGHAFRLNIDILLTVMGPWDLPWHDVLPLWERVGALFQGTRARASDAHYDEARVLAWRRIVNSIELGRPVIAYDLLGMPEYGLIVGYDHDAAPTAVPGIAPGARIAGLTLNEPEHTSWQFYADLPRQQVPHATKLEIITLMELTPSFDQPAAELLALRTASDLPFQQGSRDGWTQNGWQAYAHWAAVLSMPSDHAPDGGLGHAYNLLVLQRARRDAATFLGRVAANHPRAAEPLLAAQAAYGEVRDLLAEATELIRFPEAAGARDPETRRAVANLLRQAEVRERQGVERIDQALRALR